MGNKQDPGIPGSTDTFVPSASGTPELKTVLEWGRLTGNITTRMQAVNFSGPAGGPRERRSAAHASAAQLHGWTDGFRCTRDAYEQALKAAMPERIAPITPPAPKPGPSLDPAKRRAASKTQQTAPINSLRIYQPHRAALNEVMK